MSPPYSLMLHPPNIRPPNDARRIPDSSGAAIPLPRQHPRPSSVPLQVSAVFLIPPQSAAFRWRSLSGRNGCSVYTPKPPGFLPERAFPPHIARSAAPSRVARLPMPAVTSYDRHRTVRPSNGLPWAALSPSHDAAAKSFRPSDHGLDRKVVLQGLDDSRPRTWLVDCLKASPRRTPKWAYLSSSPHAPAVRVPPAASLQGPHRPFSHSPRTTVSARSRRTCSA
ncbi:hypothetical protein K438DRAFT_1858789 [Mycena galopus ATCC 62051]|nr:hypothetical protein K438DRAFT_1858789 [Mycena galopus ATCC 62051]